jgi:hypothetical protein
MNHQAAELYRSVVHMTQLPEKPTICCFSRKMWELGAGSVPVCGTFTKSNHIYSYS